MNALPKAERPCRVLLVDDDPDIHELVIGMLRFRSLDIVSAYDGEQACEIAKRFDFDLILLDYELPGANGLEILRRFRSGIVPDSVPVIFITGNDSHKILTSCFQAGAADYIRKPFCAPELKARVGCVLDRKQMFVQLEQLALHDSLTGLGNRALIRKRLQTAIDHSQDRIAALFFLDFDRFKLVNDSLGHDIGDQLLQQIADRLRSTMRQKDAVGYFSEETTVARFGGDEFVVLLEDLKTPNDALLVADRLLSTLDDSYNLAGRRVCCNASIGIVNNIHLYSTPDEILRDADTAMHEAKTAGKARYVLFNPEMHTNAEERLRIENDLRIAITNEELFLTYQPVVSLQTGRTVGFESLVRWKHPQRGLIMPLSFLPTAEESGLIVPMGTWVLDRACQEFATWRRTMGELAPANIHVNVSRKQLLRDLVDKVRAALKKHAIEAECLHLEVTESEIMQNPEIAKATLGELREIGVNIDMDDFGTGHSSLSCLQELPIDVLKIDRSFIGNMERSRSFLALVHAVTTLGQNLGLSVVAEGIETADQLAMLQSMECDYGQGYFFGKPMPADDVPAYLHRTARTESGAHASYPGQEPVGVSATGELMHFPQG